MAVTVDPNPINHPAVLSAQVREAIEPRIVEVGFEFDSRNNPVDRGRVNLWIDWTRQKELLSLRWDRHDALIELEHIDASSEARILASVCTSGVRTSLKLMERIEQFIRQVQDADFVKTPHNR